MTETCRGCSRSWAEDIYWTHFQFIHFAQYLPTGYEQQLAFPRRFSNSLKRKLPDKVAIRGPGGAVWNIGLKTVDDTLFLAHGWEQFVKDHKLEEKDLLVFKYNGESQFDVLMFDRESFCEKVPSYFVRKCGYTELENESLIARQQTNLKEVHTPSNAGVECASPHKSMDVDCTKVPVVVPSETTSKKIIDAVNECTTSQKLTNGDVIRDPAVAPTETTSKKFSNSVNECAKPQKPPTSTIGDVTRDPAVVPSQTNSKRKRKLVSVIKHVQTKRRGKPKEPAARAGRVNRVAAEHSSMGGSGIPQTYTSKKRLVTESEKTKALNLAQAACTNDSFSIVMRPSHVYKGFYLSGAELLPQQNQDVILRGGNSEWIARYSCDHGRRGLTRGWKRFALDNNLQEFDVCVFKPAGTTTMNNVLIYVAIFRVVEEATSLGKMNSGAKKVLFGNDWRPTKNSLIHIGTKDLQMRISTKRERAEEWGFTL